MIAVLLAMMSNIAGGEEVKRATSESPAALSGKNADVAKILIVSPTSMSEDDVTRALTQSLGGATFLERTTKDVRKEGEESRLSRIVGPAAVTAGSYSAFYVTNANEAELAKALMHHGLTEQSAKSWTKALTNLADRTAARGIFAAVTVGGAVVSIYELSKDNKFTKLEKFDPNSIDSKNEWPDTVWIYVLAAILAIATFVTYLVLRKRRIFR